MSICRVCNGSGSFFAVQPNFILKLNRAFKWFSCPSCNGLGTISVMAPAKIVMKNKLGKKLVKLNRQLDFEASKYV